jgi:hypothetical protein
MSSPPEPTPLHVKIDYLLTEARVILPGAQALLGFEFIVTLTQAFAGLPREVRIVHFAALVCVMITVVVLVAPASIHRLAFGGEESQRFLRLGSRLVTLALLPLALGISLDMYVATWKLVAIESIAAIAAAVTFLVLATLWYAIPLLYRRQARTPHSETGGA